MKAFFENILFVIGTVVLVVLVAIGFLILVAYEVINVLIRGISWTFELLCDGVLDGIDNFVYKVSKSFMKKILALNDQDAKDNCESEELTDNESAKDAEPSDNSDNSELVA